MLLLFFRCRRLLVSTQIQPTGDIFLYLPIHFRPYNLLHSPEVRVGVQSAWQPPGAFPADSSPLTAPQQSPGTELPATPVEGAAAGHAFSCWLLPKLQKLQKSQNKLNWQDFVGSWQVTALQQCRKTDWTAADKGAATVQSRAPLEVVKRTHDVLWCIREVLGCLVGDLQLPISGTLTKE